ncbi:hypothetical protein [Microbacterium hydrocarbonoxydans]|uniref:hypothetical protein n=1 Tax=Microbacterium hydrocarbonoxydans TaxID=273678 RepID=UPI003D969645
MSDLFAMFDDSADTSPEPAASTPLMMNADQRAELKALFAQLGVATAREQFVIIEELTATRISAVSELQAAVAHRAIAGLRRRVESVGQVRSGSSWDDRDSPTWIDQL